jgi:hypothetical protein
MRLNKIGIPHFDFEPTILKHVRDLAKVAKPFNFPVYAINKNLLGSYHLQSNITKTLKPFQLHSKMLRDFSSVQRVASYTQFLEQAANLSKLSPESVRTLNKFKENHRYYSDLFNKIRRTAVLQNDLASEIMRPIIDFQKIYNQTSDIGSINLKSMSSLRESLKSFEGMQLFASIPGSASLIENANQLILELEENYFNLNRLDVLLGAIYFCLGMFVTWWLDRGNDPASDAMVKSLESIDSKQTETMDYFKSIEETLSKLSHALALSSTKNYLKSEESYVTTRESPLRIAPNANAVEISRVHTNQSVLLVKKSETWLYVSFYDYVEDIPKIGWINQRNVKLVTLEDIEDAHSFEERLNEPNLDFEEILKNLMDKE